jgi:hypothetical protein
MKNASAIFLLLFVGNKSRVALPRKRELLKEKFL